MKQIDRREWLLGLGALGLGLAAPGLRAQERSFAPQPGAWREFEMTTRVEVKNPTGASRVWVPLPSVNTDYQQSLDNSFGGNASSTKLVGDQHYGARMLMAEFAAGTASPVLEVTSRIRTQNRAVDWARKTPASEDSATLRAWMEPTDLMPTDGIVKQTAAEITKGQRSDLDKVRAIYDWVVVNTHREPKVRGCGVGDIKAMLETGNLSGKCADLNALFVGLCRASGVPARDVYGIRLVPSAFGYKELGGNPANLKGAQHCRAEAYLKDYGWVAMDPADVAKVMRQESTEWIKDPAHPLVAPVKKGLFGGWEGNWLAYNTAHDVALPGSSGPKLGFLMYPQCENGAGRYDSLDADGFKYTIQAREIKA
ncbi:transglutaminase-like enzyme, predicted cysteine protease [Burkholderiales bacterium JOSHI_001]|nr:transglutaminase-like enzyme, predicted cysteine protease [Burkholderiales bacterium JOSHI_001]